MTLCLGTQFIGTFLQIQVSSCSAVMCIGSVSKDKLKKCNTGAFEVFIWNLRTSFSRSKAITRFFWSLCHAAFLSAGM